MKRVLIILYFIICITLMALSDAFDLNGLKLWAHGIEAFWILFLISGPFIFKLNRKHWIAFVLSLAFWRIAGFDYLYNLFAGLPWDFHGTTSSWDIFLSKQPEFGIVFGRIIFLTAAIFVPIRELT